MGIVKRAIDLFSKAPKIERLSLADVDTDNLEELKAFHSRLAWQVTIGELDLQTATKIMQGTSTFRVRDYPEAQLDVREYRRDGENYYLADDPNMPVHATTHGERVGAIRSPLGQHVEALKSHDDETRFIKYLDKITHIWEKIMDKKKIILEEIDEAKKKATKLKAKGQPADPKSDDVEEVVRRVLEAMGGIYAENAGTGNPDPGENPTAEDLTDEDLTDEELFGSIFDDDLVYGGFVDEEPDSGASAEEPQEDEAPETESAEDSGSIFDILINLSGDKLVAYLQDKTCHERNTLFDDVVNEYTTRVEQTEQVFNEYRKGVQKLANTFKELDGKSSTAAKFLAQEETSERIEALPNKNKGYARRQLNHVRTRIAELETETTAEARTQLGFLDCMEYALKDANLKLFDNLKTSYEKEYEPLAKGKPRKGESDSNNDTPSKQPAPESKPRTEPEQPGAEQPKSQPEPEPDSGSSDREYTVAEVLNWFGMNQLEPLPELTMSRMTAKVKASRINQRLNQLKINPDLRLVE